jgi:hypothetical protein
MDQVICCFCGETVDGEPPLVIALQFPNDSTQGLYAHYECFEKLLHPSVPYMPPREWLEN